MKKFKKLIALTCVAAMLVPTVAFAADPTSGTGEPSTGNSVIENDNSVAPAYTAVELPTIAEKTYDFQIDRDHLLADFDYVSTHVTDSYVYFKAENDPATAVNKTEGASLYLAEIEKVANTSAFLAKFDSATLTGKLTADDEYYVWVPTADDKTRGEFARIADAAADATESTERTVAVADIVKWSLGTDNAEGGTDTAADSAILREDYNSGDFIWDGNIYQKAYNKLSATDAVKYITVNTSNEVTAVDKNLYVATSTEATVAKSVVTAATKDDINYTAATTQYINKSDIATVVNKSTTPIVVSVKVDMKTTEGITYVGEDAIATDTENASLYIAIVDEAGNAAAVKNDTRNATAYYVLDGAADHGTTKYQGKADDINQATGSHNYYQYENPYPTYAEHSFKIVADVNESDDADEAWQTYVDSLTATENANTKPTIEVVYSWEVVEKTETANVYADLAGENLYTTDGSTGWASGAAAHTHAFSAYNVHECTGEGCDYVRTSQITNPVTFSLNSDETKYVYKIGAEATISSVSVYKANEYATSGSDSTVVTSAITADDFTVTSVGNAAILVSKFTNNLTEADDYVIVITASNGTHTVIYTVSE